MLKKQNLSHGAFSLIELSIVILIIGILVAGVTQSSRLIKEFRLSSVRNQSTSSPVTSISNLILWLDATNENAFLSSESEDGATISTWNDTNKQSITKFNFVQAAETNKPTYDIDGINGLPSVNFDGNDNFLATSAYDATLNPSDITIFVVVRETSSPAYRAIISTRNTNNSSYFRGFILYNNPDVDNVYHFQYGTGGGWGSSRTSATSSDEIVVISATISSSSGSEIYMNGGALEDSDSAVMSANTLEKMYIGGHINSTGGAVANFFPGRVGEVIYFGKKLKAEERQSVETYLMKKWGIS